MAIRYKCSLCHCTDATFPEIIPQCKGCRAKFCSPCRLVNSEFFVYGDKSFCTLCRLYKEEYHCTQQHGACQDTKCETVGWLFNLEEDFARGLCCKVKWWNRLQWCSVCLAAK